MTKSQRPRIAKDLEAFVGNPDNVSARVNGIISRYQVITATATPALTGNEWMAICDANNSTWLEDARQPPEEPARSLRMNVADSEPDGLAEKWDVDLLDLARKLRDMTTVEQAAVLEVVIKFWAKSDEQHGDFRAMLEACGAKIK